MTLCTAWIRQSNNTEELVFATDSTLTGGEKWDNGIKLFELPRKDCLLCFAGSTFRAYPLILNLVSSIKFNSYLSKPETDITEVLNYSEQGEEIFRPRNTAEETFQCIIDECEAIVNDLPPRSSDRSHRMLPS